MTGSRYSVRPPTTSPIVLLLTSSVFCILVDCGHSRQIPVVEKGDHHEEDNMNEGEHDTPNSRITQDVHASPEIN